MMSNEVSMVRNAGIGLQSRAINPWNGVAGLLAMAGASAVGIACTLAWMANL